MRSCVIIAFTALVVTSSASMAGTPGGPPRDAIPVQLAAFASPSDIPVGLAPRTSEGTLASAFLPADEGAGVSDGKQSYLPVLYSLILPGTGEIALGYKYRGAALVAAEVAAWVGYAYYRNQGLDGRSEFESFADAHWDYDRWITEHAATDSMIAGGATPPITFEQLDAYGRTTWGSRWPGYHPFAAKEDEKQNYYENIGKYDWFISGWEDWDHASMNTTLRTEYRGLRKKSNDDLDTADKFIYLSVATRVFSLVETILLVRKHNQAVETGSADTMKDRRYAFKARSTGLVSGEFALEISFR